MQTGYGNNQARTYLAQRINSAGPEELAAMLLEGAQRFLTQAVAAIERKDYLAKGRLLDRTSQIMQRLLGMLNPEADRKLVDKLHGIYIWWIKEMFEGSRKDRPEQIRVVIAQMGEMRSAWEQVAARQQNLAPAASQFTVEGLVG